MSKPLFAIMVMGVTGMLFPRDARFQPHRGDLTKSRPLAWVKKFTALGFASPERA
jgi:hypothetical protein